MVQHKIINDIEYKYCHKCSQWKILDDFGNCKGNWDRKNNRCLQCVNFKICSYPECQNEAIFGYLNCALHGAKICKYCNLTCKKSNPSCENHNSKKCLLCNTNAKKGLEYCIKHNPTKCEFENCNKKTLYNTKLCLIHNTAYHCKVEGCTKKKRKNGYCLNHGEKEYCKIEGCNRVLQLGGMCDEHYCSGNIVRIVKRLINNSKNLDRTYKGKTRSNPRMNTVTYQYIVDLYEKNNNCYWCDHPLKLKICGKFDLDRISIDRVDNTIGHTNENCVLSCTFCNYAKNIYSKDQWIKIINVLNGTTDTIQFDNLPVNHNNMTKYMTGILREKKKYNIETVDKKWLLDRLNANKWKCELSGFPIMPTNQSRFPANISIDRIDNNEYHIETNCQVVCSFINNGKNQVPNNEFKTWFKNRFPNCKINKVIYPREFYDKILYKDKETYLSMINDETMTIYFV